MNELGCRSNSGEREDPARTEPERASKIQRQIASGLLVWRQISSQCRSATDLSAQVQNGEGGSASGRQSRTIYCTFALFDRCDFIHRRRIIWYLSILKDSCAQLNIYI